MWRRFGRGEGIFLEYVFLGLSRDISLYVEFRVGYKSLKFIVLVWMY